MREAVFVARQPAVKVLPTRSGENPAQPEPTQRKAARRRVYSLNSGARLAFGKSHEGEAPASTFEVIDASSRFQHWHRLRSQGKPQGVQPGRLQPQSGRSQYLERQAVR